MTMFKQAYARGVALAVIQGGHAQFQDGGDAIKVADYVAEQLEFDPANPGDATAKIANTVIDASNRIRQQRPGFKAASFNRIESRDDLEKLAQANATHLMEEAEKRAEGSTIEGGDKGNMQAESPQGETKMDAAQRPPGYAEDSRGKTDVDTRPGAVGKEQDQPNRPAESPSGENSATAQSRTAAVAPSLADLMRKVAEGTTIMGGDKGNKEPTTAEGKMDMSQRPHGYAVLPTQGALGELMGLAKGPAIIGRETPQPNAPGESPSGSNSVTQHSAKAAAEDPWLAVFKKTAAECVPHIPPSLSEDEKIAHVRACMGMQVAEKAAYLRSLQASVQERTAAAPAAVPPGSRSDGYSQHNPEATHARPGAYDGRKGNQSKAAEEGGLPFFMRKDDEKDDKKDGDKGDKHENPFAKKDDKDGDKDDEKAKEAQMREHVKRIEDAMRAGAR
jgi:hypothetical protein